MTYYVGDIGPIIDRAAWVMPAPTSGHAAVPRKEVGLAGFRPCPLSLRGQFLTSGAAWKTVSIGNERGRLIGCFVLRVERAGDCGTGRRRTAT